MADQDKFSSSSGMQDVLNSSEGKSGTLPVSTKPVQTKDEDLLDVSIGELNVASEEKQFEEDILNISSETEPLEIFDRDETEIAVGEKHVSDNVKSPLTPTEVKSGEQAESAYGKGGLVVKSPEKRPLRLNRRGFQERCALFTAETAKNHPSAIKPKVPVKRIISLASVKKSSTESKEDKTEKKKIAIKRHLSDDDKKTETSEIPPKKKYKPITWP